jgi:four helix bundle protein
MKKSDFDRIIRNQLSRASTSIQLNIAEGAGRFSPKDQRNFYVIARGSAMECVAIFDLIEDLEYLPATHVEVYRQRFIEISKMLFGMIKRLSP